MKNKIREIHKSVRISDSDRGYKQTEIGLIPSDWEIGVLLNLVDKDRMIRYGIVQPGKYDPHGRYMIRGQDYSFGWANPEGFFKVGSVVEERYKNARLKGGDIILTIVGASTGQVEIIPTWLEGANITQTTARIAIDQNRTNNVLCRYLLLSKYGKQQVANYIKGGAQPGLNIGDVKKFLIPLPPTLAEQERIATALRDADALINSLEKLITKKRNIKQGAMQELLTPPHCQNHRLNGLKDDTDLKSVKSVQSVPVRDSDKWEVKKLGEYLLNKPDYGINAPAVAYSDNLPSYLRITDISEDGRFIPDNRTSVNNPNSDKYYLQKDEIVLARTGASVGKSYLYNPNDGKLVFAGFLIRIKVNTSKLNARFLKGILETKYFWDWVRVTSMRSGQPGINGNEYSQLLISIPSLNEQTAIAQTLSDMDAEIEQLEQKLSKYKFIKQGMMQELLTGKVRLNH
jgi:type I restriction enzyme S subunit